MAAYAMQCDLPGDVPHWCIYEGGSLTIPAGNIATGMDVYNLRFPQSAACLRPHIALLRLEVVHQDTDTHVNQDLC